MGGVFFSKVKDKDPAMVQAAEAANDAKRKIAGERSDMARTAAEQAAGRLRSGMRSSLLSSAKLGTNGSQTLGSTQV